MSRREPRNFLADNLLVLFGSLWLKYILANECNFIQDSISALQALLSRKEKTCTMFLVSYRNTSESLGEQEILLEHEPTGSVTFMSAAIHVTQ